MKVLANVVFCCPKCGSRYYGTSGGMGLCHGEPFPRGCRFSWDRDEDWKYFQHVTSLIFESKEEFYERGGTVGLKELAKRARGNV